MDVLLEGVVGWERMSGISLGCACAGREKFLGGLCTGGEAGVELYAGGGRAALARMVAVDG